MSIRELATPCYVPTRVHIGHGAVRRLPSLLAALASRERVVVVSGRRTPAKPWLDEILGSSGARHVLEQHASHPGIEDIGGVLEHARLHRPAAIIAIGGGSVIDTAKTVALLVRSRLTVEAALDGAALPSDSVPLIAVPTTAGSGSEVTSTATIWDRAARRKRTLAGPLLFPAHAVIDPALTATLPPEPLASAGLDALAHAVEGAWSVRSTPLAVQHGIRAAALVRGALPAAVEHGADRARHALALGSVLAGVAIAGGGTTACHAMSYHLTLAHGIPHGEACALTLGRMLDYNARVSEHDCAHPRGPGYVRSVVARLRNALQVPAADSATEAIDALLRAIGCRPLDERPAIDARLLARAAMRAERLANNPRRLDERAVASLAQPHPLAEATR